MKADTPITFAAAKYVNRGHALEDWQAIKDSQRFGDIEHLAVAVLSKGSDGVLQVEPHDPTAGHLPWVGAARSSSSKRPSSWSAARSGWSSSR